MTTGALHKISLHLPPGYPPSMPTANFITLLQNRYLQTSLSLTSPTWDVLGRQRYLARSKKSISQKGRPFFLSSYYVLNRSTLCGGYFLSLFEECFKNLQGINYCYDGTGSILFYLTITTRALVLVSKVVDISEILTAILFHELMNQYQACLYLSDCIFHCGSKYGYEIPIYNFTNFVKFLNCRLHSH